MLFRLESYLVYSLAYTEDLDEDHDGMVTEEEVLNYLESVVDEIEMKLGHSHCIKPVPNRFLFYSEDLMGCHAKLLAIIGEAAAPHQCPLEVGSELPLHHLCLC